MIQFVIQASKTGAKESKPEVAKLVQASEPELKDDAVMKPNKKNLKPKKATTSKNFIETKCVEDPSKEKPGEAGGSKSAENSQETG